MFIFKEHKKNIWALYHSNGDKMSSDLVFNDSVKAEQWMRSWMSAYLIWPHYTIEKLEK